MQSKTDKERVDNMNRKQLIKSIKEELDELMSDEAEILPTFDYTGEAQKLDKMVKQISDLVMAFQDELKLIYKAPDDNIAHRAGGLYTMSLDVLASSIMKCATDGQGFTAQLIDEMLNG